MGEIERQGGFYNRGRGIGKEIARAYVQEGAVVVLASRNKKILKQQLKNCNKWGEKLWLSRPISA